MQRFYFLLLLLAGGSLSVSAQDGILGTGFANGWGAPGTDGIAFQPSIETSRILITQPNGTGLQYFRLLSGATSGATQFAPFGCIDADWSAGEGFSYNNMPACGSGAFFIDVADDTHNYVFKTPTATEDDFIYFVIEGPVKEFVSANTAQVPLPDANNHIATVETVTVSNLLDLEGLSPGQAAYLRYTTDDFATSTVLLMTSFALPGFYSAEIPPQPDGTTVKYYLFTSGDAQLPAPDGSDADYRTINRDDKGGQFYTYTVNSALPVTYANWQGRRVKADAVQLEWSTVTEDQAVSYTIECSQDGGLQWMTRATLPATNLTSGGDYQFLDEGAPIADLQYRLRQTDIDGANNYSAIITVAGQTPALRAWPVPVDQLLNLEVPESHAGGTARLMDLTGHVQRSVKLAAGQQQLSVNDLPAGVYLLRVDGYTALRIIKN